MPSSPPADFAGTSLELSAPQMRALLDAVRDRIVEHVASLPSQPAADVEGAAALARELFEAEAPEAGIPSGEILDLLFDRAIPKSFNTAGQVVSTKNGLIKLFLCHGSKWEFK